MKTIEKKKASGTLGRIFTIDTLFEIGQALGVSFLSTSLHYSIADDSERYPAYEFEPLMASEP